MARTVSIGTQDFEKMIQRNCFYVDKTGFIKEWWESEDEVTLITRPRRFGKTLNMSMLNCFFSNKYADRGDLFEKLEIWKDEKYCEIQGTYPVIFMSFAEIKQNNYNDAVEKIKRIICEVCQQFDFLKNWDGLTETEKKNISNISYDMAFIDIEMPLVNGLTLSAQLKKVNSNIIIFIITSHDAYLDDAMDLDVFRYLSKPIDKDRFFRALNTAINYYHSNTQIITLEYYDECYSVFTSDIVYITIEERKAVIITRQKKFYTNKKLSYWKEKLKDYDYFAQPHYSYLVNLRYVSDFNKTELNINVDLKSETLPISQRNYSNFKKAYFAYIGV